MRSVTPCAKIDVHAHAILHRDLEYRTSIDISPEELIALYDAVGVERGVLQPIVSPEWITSPMTNGDTCAIARRWPDRFFWFFNADPRTISNLPDTDFSDMIRFFLKLGAVGMGELTANLYADDPMVDNLFTQLEAFDLPVTIHVGPTKGGCYGLVDEVGLPRLEKMLKKHPGLKILGHSQPFWAEIDAGCSQETRGQYPTGKVREGRLAALMREYGNLYCDMSANSCYNALRRDPDSPTGSSTSSPTACSTPSTRASPNRTLTSTAWRGGWTSPRRRAASPPRNTGPSAGRTPFAC